MTIKILNPEPRTEPLPPNPGRGVILLLVVSLLALFVLLGVSFSLVALQSLNASKLDLKINQVGDAPDTEMDLVLGQILYDTQARTVLQFHSLLRDLYGGDSLVLGNVTLTTDATNASLPRLRCQKLERKRSTTAGPRPPCPGTGNQFFTFPVQHHHACNFPDSQLLRRPRDHLRSGGTGKPQHPRRRLQPDQHGHQPYTGQFIIEAIESKLAGSVTQLIWPAHWRPICSNGARPFNGCGAGYDANTTRQHRRRARYQRTHPRFGRHSLLDLARNDWNYATNGYGRRP